jgi:hydrogenase maturation protease
MNLPADQILIAGLGNVLLRDDGVGVHAVRALQKIALPGNVIVAEIGTAVLRALHLIEAAQKIIAIDAMHGGGAPGDIYVSRIEDIDTDSAPLSLHQLSLVGAFRLLPDGRRPEITVLGIEPETIDYGMDLTPSVAAAIPSVVAHALNLVRDCPAHSAACIL